ncbi:hypothetical protein D3C81_2059750 [compost metagenome]
MRGKKGYWPTVFCFEIDDDVLSTPTRCNKTIKAIDIPNIIDDLTAFELVRFTTRNFLT